MLYGSDGLGAVAKVNSNIRCIEIVQEVAQLQLQLGK